MAGIEMYKAESVLRFRNCFRIVITHIGLRASKVWVRLGEGMSKASCIVCVEIFATISDMSTHTLRSGQSRPL